MFVVAVAVSFVLLQYAFPQMQILSAKKHESPNDTSPDEAVPYQEEQPRRPAFLSRVMN